MKSNQPTTAKAKAARKPTRATTTGTEEIILKPTAAQFHTWSEQAAKRGFPSVGAWLLYKLTCHTWPGNRLSVIAEDEEFTEWNKAALAGNLKMTDWIEKTLNAAASITNKS